MLRMVIRRRYLHDESRKDVPSPTIRSKFNFNKRGRCCGRISRPTSLSVTNQTVAMYTTRWGNSTPPRHKEIEGDVDECGATINWSAVRRTVRGRLRANDYRTMIKSNFGRAPFLDLSRLLWRDRGLSKRPAYRDASINRLLLLRFLYHLLDRYLSFLQIYVASRSSQRARANVALFIT